MKQSLKERAQAYKLDFESEDQSSAQAHHVCVQPQPRGGGTRPASPHSGMDVNQVPLFTAARNTTNVPHKEEEHDQRLLVQWRGTRPTCHCVSSGGGPRPTSPERGEPQGCATRNTTNMPQLGRSTTTIPANHHGEEHDHHPHDKSGHSGNASANRAENPPPRSHGDRMGKGSFCLQPSLSALMP